MSCWLIRPKLPNVTSITLSFARFSTEEKYDVLRVYDGANLGAPELFRGGLSGSLRIFPVTSTRPEILLRFSSDASNTRSGFLFGWNSNVAGLTLPAGQCGRRCLPALVGNGICNSECMFEGCNWDGGDCWGTCSMEEANNPVSGQHTCFAMQLGNGECDPECMNLACDFDHGDCNCQRVVHEQYGFRSSQGYRRVGA